MTVAQISEMIESYVKLMDLSKYVVDERRAMLNASAWSDDDRQLCTANVRQFLCASFFPPCDTSCQPLLVCDRCFIQLLMTGDVCDCSLAFQRAAPFRLTVRY